MAGAPPLIEDARLVVLEPIVFTPESALVVVDPDQESDPTLPTGVCDDAPQRGFPAGAPMVEQPPYVTFGGDAFRFQEQEYENACVGLRVGLQVPVGARTGILHFEADRSMESQVFQANPGFKQQIRVWVDSLERVDQVGVRFDEAREYYNQTEPPSTAFRGVDLPIDLGGARDVVLGWYFADRGQSADITQPTNPAFGYRMTSQVQEAFMEYRLALPGLAVSTDVVGADDGELVQFSDVSFQVPDDPGRKQVRFLVEPRFSVDRVEAPDGSTLGSGAVQTRPIDGRLEVVVPEATLAAAGPGTYTLRLRSMEVVEPLPGSQPIVALLLLVPLVAGVVAQRATNQWMRHSDAPWRPRVALAAMLATWMAYAGLLVAVISLDLFTPMLLWPLPDIAIAPYVVLAATIVAFAVLAQYARRRRSVDLERDLNEKERMQRELERSNRDLEQFAYVASHDLKEPLRMVSSYTQLLERRYARALDDEGRTFARYAAEGADRMGHMVDDLLSYARVRPSGDGGRAVELDAVLRLVRTQLRSLLEETGGRIEHEALPTVHGDPTQMLQLFQNLIQNALKFRHPGRSPVVQVRAQRAGRRWRIEVADNGIGMREQDKERIFEVFQRLHPRSEYEGNGIGLALCKRIVEHHGGAITVRSSPGDGATFMFDLPDGNEV